LNPPDPAVRQIVLIDAPAVLGWEAYRQIDADYFLAGTIATIEAAIAISRSGYPIEHCRL
jgi:hypothetical protein